MFAVIAAFAGWQTIEATAQRRDAMRERDRAAENFNLAEARRIEAETERDRAEQNFDAAKTAINGLVFDVVQQLREMAGFRLADLRNILDDGDWINEIHPTETGFRKLADKYLDQLKTILHAMGLPV